MKQDPLDGLLAFVSVAEASGFSAAATRLGVTPSAVSQSIRQLEKRLGTPLFSRTTRSVSLTEAGAHFLERVRPALQELGLAAEELSDRAGRPMGVLRLNVPRLAYDLVLQPVLGRFLRAHPQVQLEISIDTALVDIVGLGFDAGIRFGERVDRDMVSLPIGPPLRDCIVASPAYLAAHGRPAHPRELLTHDCIRYRFASSGQLERWRFERGEQEFTLAVSGRLVLDDASALLAAALDGLGVANLIDRLAQPAIDDGRLVRLFADWHPPLPTLTLYYPDRRRVPPKLRALIDCLRAAF